MTVFLTFRYTVGNLFRLGIGLSKLDMCEPHCGPLRCLVRPA